MNNERRGRERELSDGLTGKVYMEEEQEEEKEGIYLKGKSLMKEEEEEDV